MNERVKEIRKMLKLTQEDFSKKINMSRSNLCAIETGRVAISNRVLKNICKNFSINESWLRTGEGEIFNIIDEDEQFHRILGEWLLNCDELTKETVLCLNQLSREEFEIVVRMLKSLVKNK